MQRLLVINNRQGKSPTKRRLSLANRIVLIVQPFKILE